MQVGILILDTTLKEVHIFVGWRVITYFILSSVFLITGKPLLLPSQKKERRQQNAWEYKILTHRASD